MTSTKWDVVVNISGQPLPAVLQAERKIDWKIQDPMGQKQPVHEKVRDEIENLVMRLILELRSQSKRT
jgi:protein-tyrosine-phosphatase